MDTAANDNGSGKITLALLGQKVDRLADDVKDWRAEIKEMLAAQEARVMALEIGQVRRQEQIDALKEQQKEICGDVEYLKKRDFWGTFLSSALAAVAAVFAWFK